MRTLHRGKEETSGFASLDAVIALGIAIVAFGSLVDLAVSALDCAARTVLVYESVIEGRNAAWQGR